MQTELKENSWRSTWFFALGAGWSGVLFVAAYHLFLGPPQWLEIQDGSAGWTIYPPMSALPQAIPGQQAFDAFVLTLSVCSSVFLGAWVLALLQRQRQASPKSGLWFWLSLLLLVPPGVHMGGSLYVSEMKRAAEADLLQDYIKHQAETLEKGPGADSSDNSPDYEK